jgi:hypothetical protein
MPRRLFFLGLPQLLPRTESVLQRFLNGLGLLARFRTKDSVPLLKASVALRQFSVHASIGLADS